MLKFVVALVVVGAFASVEGLRFRISKKHPDPICFPGHWSEQMHCKECSSLEENKGWVSAQCEFDRRLKHRSLHGAKRDERIVISNGSCQNCICLEGIFWFCSNCDPYNETRTTARQVLRELLRHTKSKPRQHSFSEKLTVEHSVKFDNDK